MTVDPELPERLARLRDAHQPDRARIRARLEAGMAASAQADPAPVAPLDDPGPAQQLEHLGLALAAWVEDPGPGPEPDHLKAAPTGRADDGGTDRHPTRARPWWAVPLRAAAVLVVAGLTAAGVVVAAQERPAGVEAGGAPAAAPLGVAPPYVAPTPPAPPTTAGDPAPTTSPNPTAGVPSTTAGAPVTPGGGLSPTGSGSAVSTGASVPATSPPRSTAAPAATPLCRHKDEVDLGRLHLVNDLWGTTQATAGSQCVTATSGPSAAADGSGLTWSTRWSWTGNPGQPKSFSSLYLGWDWGWKEAGTGLPRAMADHPGLRSRWDFSVALDTPGRMEVAYDLWFHDRPDPGGDTLPVSEVRIILHRTPMDLPAAGRLGTVTLEGGTWDVYRFGNSWDVITFYRTTPTTSADVDLGRFLDEAARHTRLPWLTAVHAGVGVNEGAGRVDTSRFTLTLS